MENLVIGTAGHVDHGKTSLVRALTGINTDTLKEEQARGITVNLGFAYLKLDEQHTVGIVDVPGHEKLIKNMIAGVCGINLILLTVACDDGIMPQTREHMEIIRFLKINNIVAVLTKVDLVSQDRKEEVKKAIRDEFGIQQIVEFSIYDKETTKNVIKVIKDNLKEEKSPAQEIFRLPVDRVFTVKGQGVVVTGSSLSGFVRIGDELELLPSKMKVKVRGIQSFNKVQTIAYKHMRVALNLGGVKKEDIKRGTLIVTKGIYTNPSLILDVKITVSKSISEPLNNLDRYKFYYLANEIKCRLKLINCKQLNAGEVAFCQLLLDEPIYASNKDVGVLRQINPIKTIAGIEIVNVFGEYVNRKDSSYTDLLQLYEKQDIPNLLERYITEHPFVKVMDLKQRLGLFEAKDEDLIQIINNFGLILNDGSSLTQAYFHALSEKIITLLSNYHKTNPHEQGINRNILQRDLQLEILSPKTFSQLILMIKDIKIENDKVKLANFSVKYSKEEQEIVNRIKNFIDSFSYQPPKLGDILTNITGKNIKSIYYSLIKEKELIPIAEDIALTKEKFTEMIKLFDQFFAKNKVLTINDTREILNTSRKYLVMILEYLDKIGYTRRIEEGRVKRI